MRTLLPGESGVLRPGLWIMACVLSTSLPVQAADVFELPARLEQLALTADQRIQIQDILVKYEDDYAKAWEELQGIQARALQAQASSKRRTKLLSLGVPKMLKEKNSKEEEPVSSPKRSQAKAADEPAAELGEADAVLGSEAPPAPPATVPDPAPPVAPIPATPAPSAAPAARPAVAKKPSRKLTEFITVVVELGDPSPIPVQALRPVSEPDTPPAETIPAAAQATPVSSQSAPMPPAEESAPSGAEPRRLLTGGLRRGAGLFGESPPEDSDLIKFPRKTLRQAYRDMHKVHAKLASLEAEARDAIDAVLTPAQREQLYATPKR